MPLTPHFMPKHSFFRATVQVLQIDHVPFLNGQLAVRWKFKNVHTHRPGILGIVKTRSKQGDKRKDELDNASPPALVVSTGSSTSDSSSNTRSPVTSTHREPLTPNTPFSSNAANSSNPALYLHLQNPKTSPDSPKSTFDQLPTPPATAATTTSFTHQNSAPRGYTPYLDLKDHSVQWNYTLSTPIRFDIDRDTGSILPCPLKLVIMQRIQPDDYLLSPEVHRLGALYLNLSEYVGHGLVDRRYLLRESRTNATLRLTIELEYISGESHYIPPPLPKGEILNGLSNYLSGELYRSRAAHSTVHHGVDLYGPYSNQEELELDLFGTCANRRTPLPRSVEDYEIIEGDSDFEDESRHAHQHEELSHPTPAFDVERLPLAYGTKTTETLIEAIFNPVRTLEPRCESPFTIFIPKPAPPIPLPSTLAQANKPNHHRNTNTEDSSLGLGLSTTSTPSSAPATRPPSSLSDFATLQQPRRHEEVASLYSTESSTTGSSSGSNAMSQSGHSHHSHPAAASSASYRKSMRTNSVGSKESGQGGRMKGWWRKVSTSRPQTPIPSL